MDEHFKSKLQLTERDCQNLYASQREGILEIGAYEINRIFLYAIITPVHQWSATFGGKLAEGSDALQGGLFPRVLSFVKNKFEQTDTIMTSALKNESYPERLIDQLEYLSNKYRISLWEDLSEEEKNSKHQSGFDENKRPKWMLLLPHQVITSEEWINVAQVLKNLGEDVFESHYRPSAVNIHRILKEVEIIPALKTIPKAYRLSYVKQHTHQVKELASIVPVLPIQDWPIFIQILGNTIQTLIRDEKELGNILCSLPNEHWPAFINALGINIRTFIRDGTTLALALYVMTPNNWPIFIGALHNTIQSIILSKNELALALSTLLKIHWILFIRALGSTIQPIIRNSDRLLKVLDQIQECDRLLFIQALGSLSESGRPILLETLSPTIKTLVKNHNALAGILTAFPKEDWPAIIQKVGNTITTILPDGYRFSPYLYPLDKDDFPVFIKILGNTITTIFQDGYQLAALLSSIPQENWPKIIGAFGNTIKTIIPNSRRLLEVFYRIQEEQRPLLIKAMHRLSKEEQPTFIETFETAGFYIKNKEMFAQIVSKFTNDDWPAFIQALAPNIRTSIRSRSELVAVLSGIPKQHWAVFIHALGSAIGSFVTKGSELASVLSELPKQDWATFIPALIQTNTTNILNGHQLAEVLHGLSKQDWPSFIQAFGPAIGTVIKDKQRLTAILSCLPKQDLTAFIRTLKNIITTIFPNGHALAEVLPSLPEDYRLALIPALGDALKTIIKDGYELAKVLSSLSIQAQHTLIQALGYAILRSYPIPNGNYSFSPKITQLLRHAFYLQKEIYKVNPYRELDTIPLPFFNTYNHQKKTEALRAFYGCLFTSNLPECNTFALMDPKHLTALLDDVEIKNIVNNILDDLGLEKDFQFGIPTLKMC